MKDFKNIDKNDINKKYDIFFSNSVAAAKVAHVQGGPKKPDHFLKCITFLYNDLERQSIYQNVQLFIRSKNYILNAAVFKYSLHKVRETTLH